MITAGSCTLILISVYAQGNIRHIWLLYIACGAVCGMLSQNKTLQHLFINAQKKYRGNKVEGKAIGIKKVTHGHSSRALKSHALCMRHTHLAQTSCLN